MYHSVVKVLKNRKLEFFKTKLQSNISYYASMHKAGSDIFAKSSDTYAKQRHPG